MHARCSRLIHVAIVHIFEVNTIYKCVFFYDDYKVFIIVAIS